MQPAGEVQVKDRLRDGESKSVARTETNILERRVGNGLCEGAMRTSSSLVDKGDAMCVRGLAIVSESSSVSGHEIGGLLTEQSM